MASSTMQPTRSLCACSKPLMTCRPPAPPTVTPTPRKGTTAMHQRCVRCANGGEAGGLHLRCLELAPGLEPGTCCLQDSRQPSTASCLVPSLQLRSGRPSSRRARVGPSSPWWNNIENDNQTPELLLPPGCRNNVIAGPAQLGPVAYRKGAIASAPWSGQGRLGRRARQPDSASQRFICLPMSERHPELGGAGRIGLSPRRSSITSM
jgi:hypothetical protein